MGVTGRSERGSGLFTAGRPLGGASRDPVDLPPGRAFSILAGTKGGGLWTFGPWVLAQAAMHMPRGLAWLPQLCDVSLLFT